MTNARARRADGGRRGFEALTKKMRDTGITRADILRFGIACALHTPDPDLAFVPLALIFEFPNQNQHARLDFVAQLYDKFVIIYHETHDGEPDLARTFNCRVERWLTCLDVAHDVLNHYDRVVDDKTDRDR